MNCTQESKSRATLDPNICQGCMTFDSQPDIVITNNQNPRLPDITLSDTLDAVTGYNITLLDVHVVANEERIRDAKQEKIDTLKPTTDALGTRHTLTTIAISMGSRIPLIDQHELGVLDLDEKQFRKLQNKIWHNTLTDLHTIHTCYKKIQEIPTTETSKTRRKTAIPRRKGGKTQEI